MAWYFIPQSLGYAQFSLQPKILLLYFLQIGFVRYIFKDIYARERFSFYFYYGTEFCWVYYSKVEVMVFEDLQCMFPEALDFKFSVEKQTSITFSLYMTSVFPLKAFSILSFYCIFNFLLQCDMANLFCGLAYLVFCVFLFYISMHLFNFGIFYSW